MSTLDLKSEFHDPVILYKPLSDFTKAFMDAVARHDEALLDDLTHNFGVQDDQAFRIAFSKQHGNEE